MILDDGLEYSYPTTTMRQLVQFSGMLPMCLIYLVRYGSLTVRIVVASRPRSVDVRLVLGLAMKGPTPYFQSLLFPSVVA